jgi:hypothetical protein
MPVLIKEFEATSDEMWACGDQLIPWLKGHIGEQVNSTHALKGIDSGRLDSIKVTYREVRGQSWKYESNIVGLTHYVGEGWQVFVVYSMIDEKQEFIIQLDNDIDAIQCKLAVL